MTISQMPPAPDPSDRSTFNTRAYAWSVALNTFATQANLLATELNTALANAGLGWVSTSTTSLTIGTGGKSLTVGAGLGLAVGMQVKLTSSADITRYMVGTVTGYTSGTGALSLSVTTTNGSGTYADWALSPYPTSPGVGDHAVIVHTGNGNGSTNNKIRRYTTTLVNAGTDITYADSATAGASFTINGAGLYAIYMSDQGVNTGLWGGGVSLNSAQLTTAIDAIAIANRLCMGFTGATPWGYSCGVVARLSAGDMIRPHTQGSDSNANDRTYFSIRKVGL